jgi:hypothetical protein
VKKIFCTGVHKKELLDQAKKDFRCLGIDRYGKCEEREFRGHNDLVILKLNKYDKNDKSFFTK